MFLGGKKSRFEQSYELHLNLGDQDLLASANLISRYFNRWMKILLIKWFGGQKGASL